MRRNSNTSFGTSSSERRQRFGLIYINGFDDHLTVIRCGRNFKQSIRLFSRAKRRKSITSNGPSQRYNSILFTPVHRPPISCRLVSCPPVATVGVASRTTL